jgi:hypothetical protein
MKLYSKISALGAVLVVATAFASADTLTLGSSTTNTFDNSAVVYGGYLLTDPGAVAAGTTSATFVANSGGIWKAPGGGSQYVSSAANTGPGDSPMTTLANGYYTFYSTFNLTDPTNDTGSIMVLADDTTDVYLNGHLLQAAAGGPNSTCQADQPNCVTPLSVPLADFVTGQNVFQFNVAQLALNATGLDFYGSISPSGVTPEPSTLMLLGTGLIGSAGALFRKMRAQ